MMFSASKVSVFKVLVAALAAVLYFSAPSLAGSCLEGGCHGDIGGYKYLHGPLAMELAGAEGCVNCHQPAGAPCTAAKGGQYKFAETDEKLCVICHDKSESPRHVGVETGCVDCHSPHGSNDSQFFVD